MPRHIGIVGCSAPGAALCFQTICIRAGRYLGEHHHPEVSMHVLDFADHIRHVRAADWDALGDMLLTSARRLSTIGADFVICPDNTAHTAYERIASRLPLPWLHIVDPVVAAIQAARYQRVGLLGTQALLGSEIYQRKLRSEQLVCLAPLPEELTALNALIFGELSAGIVSAEGIRLLETIARRMRDEQRCDALILGCTELPLLLDAARPFPLPALDSTRLLAEAAVLRAVHP